MRQFLLNTRSLLTKFLNTFPIGGGGDVDQYFLDTFTEAAPPVLLDNHTSDSGHTWADVTPASNTINPSGTVSGTAVTSVISPDLPSADTIGYLNCDASSAGNNLMAPRYRSAADRWIVDFSQLGAVVIFETIGGSFFVRSSTADPVLEGQNIDLVATMNGTSIDVDRVGGASASYSSSNGLTETTYAMRDFRPDKHRLEVTAV